MKIFVIMNAQRWSDIKASMKTPQGEEAILPFQQNSEKMGDLFLPVYYDRQQAEKDYPNATIAEAEVPDAYFEKLKN